MKKRVLSILLVLCMLSAMFATVNVSAAISWPTTNGIKTYVLSTGNNTTVYQTATSTNKYGTIYASDLITIIGYSGSRLKVSYPISGNKTKIGYIDKSKVTSSAINVATDRFTATGKLTVYRRPGGGATIGSITKGDVVYRIATSGSYTQLIYPISGGQYKMGWCSTSSLPTNKTGIGTSVTEGTYYLQSACGNKALDVNGSGTTDGTNLLIWSLHGGSNQRFRIKKHGNYYLILAEHSGKAVDISGGSSASGTNVHQWTLNYTNAQLWYFEDAGNGYYYITSALGTRLDVNGASSADGTNVHAWEKNNTAAQKWKLVPVSGTSEKTSSGFDPIWPCANTYTVTTLYKYSSGSAHSCRFKYGIDIGAPKGENVLAVESGTVIKSEYSTSSGFGNWIMIQHSNGKVSLYAHLSTRKVSTGEGVTKGQVIGQVGNTSAKSSLSPHLHFELGNSNTSGAAGDPYQEYYKTKYAGKIVLTQAAKKYSTP